MAIDQSWLEQLVAQREPESDSLDFKRQLYSNDSRKDFAGDVVALANAHGGMLLLGVEEDKEGRASAIAPLSGNAETEILRMDAWLSAQVFPRLRGYRWHRIDLAEGYALALQIPPQVGGPYQASFGSWKRFTIRTGLMTSEMDYQQLANAFGQRSRVLAELRQWRKDRSLLLQQWIHGGRLVDSAWAFFHVMPLAAFSDGPRVDLGPMRREAFIFRGHRGNTQYNFDGLISTLAPLHHAPRAEYVQFFAME